MNHLSTTLNFLMSKHKRKQSDIAITTQMNPGAVSGFVSGTRPCGPKSASTLAKSWALPADQDEVMRAWLLDQIEEAGYTSADLARLAGAGDPGFSSPIPTGLRDTLETLLRECHRPDVRDTLMDLALLVGNLRPLVADVLMVADAPGPAMPPRKEVTYGKKKK